MKYLLYIYIPLILLLSCVGKRAKTEKIEKPVEEIKVHRVPGLAKLKFLMSLSQDSIMDYFDLSNDSIRKFPDLSKYTIRTLDLSFNLLDTFIEGYLPQKIERLILSHNKLKKKFWIVDELPFNLKEVDISYNNIERISIAEPVFRLIASHNNLTYVNFNHQNIQYLDVSFNPHLSNVVNFYPSKIDTVIRDSIANDEPLYYLGLPPGGRDIGIMYYTNSGNLYEMLGG